ncbi:invasion associated locus B family protein [Bradyrhizobium ontarionense]|uniref:Invasion associated locus B family protein n=1 Tax=Bradyrhizobium ontarionense TaxID=2898149 RepID=A0ABY3RG93_9BRAD|nr:invasion associated locus B family protein [Bradyrhizobium sp. A19]UFZ06474.1 invasion associated locus B family protein [Bradyrhizobium sp. A19]
MRIFSAALVRGGIALALAHLPALVPHASAENKPAQEIKLSYSPWSKACTRDADVDGKQICFTTKTARAVEGEMSVVAVLVEKDGDTRKVLRVVLPLGMQTVHGTRILVDAEKPMQSPYLFCAAEGCVSDYSATPELIDMLKKGKSLVVQAINSNGAPLSFPLPLADLEQVLAAKTLSWKAVDEQQRKMLVALFKIRNDKNLAILKPDLVAMPPWTKFCLKGKDADAKQVCFTGKDARIDSGQPVVAAVVIEPEADPKKLLRLTLPLGMDIATGTRLLIGDDVTMQKPFVICFKNGCMSDYEFTPELLGSLRRGQAMTIQATLNTGRVVSMSLPLRDFNKAYDGAPVDPKAYEAYQKKLQQEMAQRAGAKQQANRNDGTGSEASPPATESKPAPVAALLVPRSPGRRVALVIGNSAYQNVPALPNPGRDAILVADALRRANFQMVTLQNDLNREQLVGALREFARQAESADWAVVYYAGHGMEVAGVNYLVPVDARIGSDRDVSLEAVSIDQVLNSAERAKRLRLVLLDACRDNPFASQMKRTMTVASRSVSRGLAQMEPDPGTLVVFAAKHGETALDGDAANSPFATAFVKNMQVPGVEVRRLFDNVRDDVMDMTERRQQPYTYGSVPGRVDFYFATSK